MNTSSNRHWHNRLSAACGLSALVAAALVLGGCNRYMQRSDSITLNAGNAPRSNIVAHTVDPWPAHVDETHIHSDGTRIAGAIDRYKKGEVTRPEGISTTTGAGN